MSGFHIRNLLKESQTISVGGATVVFNPQALTVADFEALDEARTRSEGAAFTPLVEMAARMIMSWDLEDDDGPIPTSADGIRRVPYLILDRIMDEIIEHGGPPEEEGKGSSGASRGLPSDSTAEPSSSLNGGDSSRRPDTSASLLGNLPASPLAG